MDMKMLPRLNAEEALHHVLEISVGSGAIKQNERRKIMNDWLRLAGHQKKKVKLSRKQHEVMLAAMGIGTECRRN